MFITPREAKWRIDSFRRAGQLALMQRLAASPSSRTILPPQTGQCVGMRKGFAVRALGGHAHDLGDDVAGAFDHHLVADLQAEALDLVLVVQRGAGDGDAADLDGLEVGDRGERAGAAHLHLDVFDRGGGLARGVLVGDGPARRFGGEAELALLVDGIDLDDDAVDFVGQVLALGLPTRRRRRAPRRWCGRACGAG